MTLVNFLHGMGVRLNINYLALVFKNVKKIKKELFLLVFSIFFGGTVSAIEEPDYQIIDKELDFEIRHYKEYLVAEVSLNGDFSSSGGQAFRILAGYIFGDNTAKKKMNMTSPVESQSNLSEEMAMTAPVTSIADGEKYIYRFVMEKKYSLDSLPIPNDSRIKLKKINSRFMAVKKYSGTWSEENYNQSKKELLEHLRKKDITVVGLPIFARYNAPFVPWFLRRNEVLIEIDWSL